MPSLTCVQDFTTAVDKVASKKIIERLCTQIPPLNKVLKSKKIKTHVFYSNVSESYLVMVHILVDAVAIAFCKSNLLPRGYPIIVSKEGVVTFGFHGKFANDRRQIHNLSEFENAEMIQLTLKYSGFLGQLIIWHVNGKLFWTATSKNSTNNVFSENAIAIIKQKISNDDLVGIYQAGGYACGEVMSFEDQTHGAKVLSEGFVCTCVGRFTFLPGDTVYVGTELSNIMPHQEMHDFCLTHHIPVGELWTTDNVMQVAEQMERFRDTMTLKKLREIFHDLNVRCHQGTVDHAGILGDDLEGMVIWKWFPGKEKPEALKFKFPKYTTKTFGLRAFMSNRGNQSMLSTAFKSHVDNYLDFWVISPEGRKYWREWLYTVALREREFISEQFIIHEFDPRVGLHIHYADLVEEPLPDAVSQFNKAVGLPNIIGKATVIVIVGPVGVGKTTYGNYLQNVIDHSLHIDGDQLYHDRILSTMELGKERAPATRTAILNVLAAGKIPIVSCGGGVLFNGNNNRDLCLSNLLAEQLGLELELVVYLPCAPGDVHEFYKAWKVDDVIRYRLSEGTWTTRKTVEKFLQDMQILSSSNHQFAQGLLHHASEVITYIPLRKGGTRSVVAPPQQISLPIKADTIYANQVRILAQFSPTKGQTKTGHFTVHYSTCLRSFSTLGLSQLKRQIARLELPGILVQSKNCSFVTLRQRTGEALSKLLPSVDLERPYTDLHITVNSGKHAAATMREASQQFHHWCKNGEGPISKMVITIPDSKGEAVKITEWKTVDVTVCLYDVMIL
jgi:adenylate kinase family enzyme